MTYKEFVKLNIGDKVQVVKRAPKGRRFLNPQRKMDKWFGEIITVERFIMTIFGEKAILCEENDWTWYSCHIARRVKDE